MAIVAVTDFRRAILSLLIGTLDTFYLKLYVNNHTPIVTDTAAAFTEPSGSWYTAVLLSSWGAAFVNGSNQGETDEVVHTYTASGTVVSEDVYGYFVTDGSGNLAWAEINVLGPQPMSAPGLSFSVRPRLMVGELC